MSFAVIGLGHIGRRHALLIDAQPSARLVAICDPLPENKLNRPDELSSVPLFKDMAALLSSDVAFDVACICTPNGLHAGQAIECLKAGKHVVVEKPLALNIRDCLAIIEAAQNANKHVFGVMQNRYSPASDWLKQQLDDGRLGKILQVHLNCFWNRDHRYYTSPPDGKPHPWHGDEALDGGVLFTQFAHFIDLLCWCFGDVSVQSARFANQKHENIHAFPDSGVVHFSLGDQTLGSLNFSTAIWDRNFESTLTVISEKGTVKLGGQYMNEVKYCHVEGLEFPELPPSSPANNYGPYTGSAANHHFVIDNVVDVLNNKATVATPATEGLAVVQVIQDIYALGANAGAVNG
ncbi:Gfo/Idh/MocA family oxidoreductase [Neolewinella aurantiaca]|uniref:Gfo/Idh/MocA family oxidoreductase n=1 Tax=Neolewinella aurantiaca TaxID=2602767 RepID=A0A5C7FYH8_9BACT|nr:Gfo/Idh/MocA family oxidoreductase [Neolewinella aurantiaca]